ncbi:mitotic checkpoint serine/threonine-protein kinase BUB1 beta-like isoform X2 [Myxocyprinus asiaticus]|uniref:mitotic checkpoint serine/threonine-protein kinase BUB1 beta-like isoform X2 n=1 Tax=Myxocyprinus asiaticus TaxID=70543 RepID=UPI002223059A|nr:mitotic checkpoint serine/threonine-protein kinase BUB1 beta-like isoform X2 [Myxocyprinus asiaticus]
MALGFEKAKCEFSDNNSSVPPDMRSVPENPTENAPSSQMSQTQEQPAVLTEGQLQIMYCKGLVYQCEEEFSFEELRAQRYYKAMREKAEHLKKMKQELQRQIEQKQRLIQQRNSTAPPQSIGEEVESSSQTSKDMCESAVTRVKPAPCKIYSEQEVGSKCTSSVNQEEASEGGSDSKLQKTATSKPFTIFDENARPNKIASANRRSLKLPTLNLKAQKSNAELSNDKDASISRSEEAIINGHWNKTLCRSPNDTCEFARAAQLSSTPFGGVDRQKKPEAALPENLSKTAPETMKAPNADAAIDTKKLSPILEISQEWGGTSFATFSHQPMKHSDNSEVTGAAERSERVPENVVKSVDVCSAEVRIGLLHQTDVTSSSNFHRESGLLPATCGDEDLNLGGEMLFYRSKLGKLKDYTLYSSSTGTVVLKVDSSAVPWDFFIGSKLRARLSSEGHGSSDVHISCYVYENGCITLWSVPSGVTVQDILAEPVAHRYRVPLVVIQLLEMLKQSHSCHVIHGGLKAETLYLYGSGFLALDFSHSVDLELQTEVQTAQDLPSAQIYIEQGLLLPIASPYQVDLLSVAEIVHMLLFNRPMKVVRRNSGWSLDEDSESHHSPVEPVWKEIFHNILNPGDASIELILSDLLSKVRNCFTVIDTQSYHL